MQRSPRALNVVNIVATGDLEHSVDLDKLVCQDGFRYDAKKYHCAYLKDERTRAKVSIFASGKMICVGAKSVDDAKHDLNYAMRRLVKLGLVSRKQIHAKLRNIVATGDLGRAIDIGKLSTQLPSTIYDPAQFAAVIYFAKELEGASILIFASGKLVFAGLRREELLNMAQKVVSDLAELAN